MREQLSQALMLADCAYHAPAAKSALREALLFFAKLACVRAPRRILARFAMPYKSCVLCGYKKKLVDEVCYNLP